jgi:4-hydroxy-tetrahydrodipicolinate synthase
MVPIITPVDEDDRVDEKALRQVIDYVIEGGVHGVFIGGSTGEAPLFVMREWVRMMEICIDQANGRVPLWAGVMDASTQRAIEKARVVRDLGYKSFVASASYYIVAQSASEHLRHFGALRDAVPEVEMVVYNIPPCTGSCLALDTMLEMARRGWIRYVKDSSNRDDLTLPLIEQGRDIGLGIFCGSHEMTERALLAGADGIVPGLATYEPWTFVEAYEAAVAGDRERLAAAQKRVDFLVGELISGYTSWLSGIKYAMSTLGIGNGRPVTPVEPPNEEQKQRIRALTPRGRG